MRIWQRVFRKRLRFPTENIQSEFYACDAEGDHAIVSEIISVDTTAPVIMLASPMSGDSFAGESITVTATADKDAEYSFKINGNAVSPQESDILQAV